MEEKVEYWIYPTDEELEPLSTLAKLWTIIDESVNRFLWHQQMFNLRVVHQKDSWLLYGSVAYGESVEDEWMVVAILKFITSMVDCVCARVTDTDGEILLIEAADCVPRWAGEPSVAEGRVFLFNGQVHLLPVCQTPGNITPFPCGVPDPSHASRFIRQYPHLTRAGPTVQQAIDARVGNLVADCSGHQHRTTVRLPELVAYLIHNNKQAVSDLINALRDKDHLDLRNCRAMKRVRPGRLRAYSVTFPRCLYALLNSITVRPHRSSGWKVDEKKKAEMLGFQLSLGLEIILSRHRKLHEHSETSPNTEKFLKKLEDVGYFQGELAGSVKYKSLLSKAKEFMRNSQQDSHHTRLDDLVDVVTKFDTSADKAEPEPPSGWLPDGGIADDDESWMEVTPESLDKLLAARFGVATPTDEDNIPAELNAFLSRVSGLAGVDASPRPNDSHSNDDDRVDLDPQQLIDSMQKLLGADRQTRDDEGSDFSDDSSDDEEDCDVDPVIVDYMSRLDCEVEQVKGRTTDLPDQDRPLQVDASVLSNLLSSYSQELGVAGPSSSLFTSMGVNPGRKEEKQPNEAK